MTPDVAVLLRAVDLQVLGTRIRNAREARGLTQTQAAGDDASTAYISRIESGQRRPDGRLLEKIAARIGTTVEELLTDTDPDSLHAETIQHLTRQVDHWRTAAEHRGDVLGEVLAQNTRVLAKAMETDQAARALEKRLEAVRDVVCGEGDDPGRLQRVRLLLDADESEGVAEGGAVS